MDTRLDENQVTLITGCYGFIGTHLVKKWLENSNHRVIGMDSITYAARPEYLTDFLKKNPQYSTRFTSVSGEEVGDIRNQEAVSWVMRQFKVNHVIHLAAESHVCKSISAPRTFFETNVMGTFSLIHEFSKLPHSQRGRFLQVSTDEVFGELPSDRLDLKFSHDTPLQPRSPYAASKAGAEHVVQCYTHTYGIDTVITNCTNNFGRYQHEEKLIPKTVKAILENKPITIYGDGNQVRDWISVENHCDGLLAAFEHALLGDRILFGGNWEMSVRQVVAKIKNIMGRPEHPVEYTLDRPTDDRRYAVTLTKAKELGWKPLDKSGREEALKSTLIALEEEFKGEQ